MKRKIIAWAMMAVMIVTLFAGCGEKTTTDPVTDPAAKPDDAAVSTEPEKPNETVETPAGDVTLKVANWDTDTMPQIPQLIQAFEAENPGIKVEIVDIPSADYVTKLNVMLNGGSEVDAFWIKDGDTTKSLYEKNQLADLTNYISQDSVDLSAFNGLAERFVFDGKNVALPARTDYYVLYYNKDIFDAAGLSYPTNDMTWAQWEELAGKLTSGEGTEKKYGGFLHTWQACVQNWAVQDGQHTILDTDYSFMKPTYEMALRMQTAGTIMDYGTLQTGGIHYSSPFLQGDVATLPMGTWFMTTIIQKKNDGESTVNWGVATLPHPEGVEAGWTVGSATPMAINEASQNKDAAWKFLNFVTSDAGAKIYAANGAIPGRANVQNLEDIVATEGMPADALAALEVKNISLDRPVADKVADVNQMLGEEHSLIMLEEVTLDEGLATMGTRSKEIQG